MNKSIVTLLLVSATLTAHAGLFDSLGGKEKKQEPKTPAQTAPAEPGMTDAVKAQIVEASKAALAEVKTLMNDPATSAPIKEQLTKLADNLAGAKDGASAEALSKIVALKPTEQQMGLVKELQGNVSTLVLGRNFSTTEGAAPGAVKAALDAIKAKDTPAILSNLQKLAADNKLTDGQKQMAGNLLTSWNPKLAAASEKAKAGIEKLKGFGL